MTQSHGVMTKVARKLTSKVKGYQIFKLQVWGVGLLPNTPEDFFCVKKGSITHQMHHHTLILFFKVGIVSLQIGLQIGMGCKYEPVV